MTVTITTEDWTSVVDRLGPGFARRAAAHDRDGTFVAENYADLKAARMMSAGIPAELGGGGLSHSQLCDLVHQLAKYCPSTALAYSMHSHLIAATVWKHLHGMGGEELLRKVADQQLVLLSTGGTDWVNSNGTLTKVDGGYRLDARKIFGSGAPAADILVGSARYEDPEAGWQVLHFSLPLTADGVTIEDDWNTLGMRGTGSNTITIDQAFVPDAAISLTRPSGEWPTVWSLVVGVAFPVFLAPYVSVARSAAELALETKAGSRDDASIRTAGQMSEALMRAELAWEDMKRHANDYDFEPSLDLANRILIQKGILAKASVETVQRAIELTGGRGYFRGFGLEQMLRDVMAVGFHPLKEKDQEAFTGRVALGLDPVG